MHNSQCCGKRGCSLAMTAKTLVVIGGINWGLVGLGMLFGNADWNVIHMILGSIPVLEAVVYVLVGVAAVIKLFTCRCKKCGPASNNGEMDQQM